MSGPTKRPQGRRLGRARDALLHDLSVAARRLAKRPAATAAAVVTLALAIGANAAVFTLVDGILLERLPYEEPERLVQVWEMSPEGRPMRAGWGGFLDWRERSSAFDALAAYSAWRTTVLGGDRPGRPMTAAVSADFFRVFRTTPAAGRLPAAADHRPGAAPVAVVSHRFWRSQLGGAASALAEHRLELHGHRAQVVGVLPPGFDQPWDADVWLPIELLEPSPSRTAHNFHVVGRLRDEASPRQAEAELTAITAGFVDGKIDPYLAVAAQVVPLADELAAPVRRPLLILQGAALLVLLIACANLASTSLARGLERRDELAVRASLGAGRGRLLAQLFTESLALSLLGAGAGTVLAAAILEVLPRLVPVELPRLAEVGIDLRVGLAIGALAVVSALLFGLLPALRVTAPSTALGRTGARGTDDRRQRHAWRALVATQVALATALLVGSGLLIRSFWNVLAEDPGFATGELVAIELDLPAGRYGDDDAIRRFHETLLGELAGFPGAQEAGLVNHLPLRSNATGRMEVEGAPPVDAVGYRVAGGGYFRALEIPLVAGRTFDERDHVDTADAVVVNQTLAERAWPGQDPIGRRMNAGGMDTYYASDRWATVIGVVADVRHRGPVAEPEPEAFFSFRQRPGSVASAVAVVRTAGDAEAALAGLRELVRGLDPEVPAELTTMERVVAGALADRRFPLVLLGSFALVALILAALGIYGVIAYDVARRHRELGIRLALGAEPGRLRNAMVAGSMATVAVGLAAGVAGALALTRLLESLLYGVGPADPVSLTAGAALLAAAALAASLVPARRAARIDPAEMLRSE